MYLWDTPEVDMAQLGDILVADGAISDEQLRSAMQVQQETGKMLGRVLVDEGLLSEPQLVKALAEQIGLPFIDLSEAMVDAAVIGRIPGQVCRSHRVLPIAIEENRLILAMSDPGNVVARDDIRTRTGMDIRIVVATSSDIDTAIDRFYRADSDLDDITTAIDVEQEQQALDSVREVVEDAPIVKFVNLLITQGIMDGASDIHLEPNEHDLLVRFRIDGVLHEMMHSPKAIHTGVVSRLKIMAEMNIAERRIPQDGRLSVNAQGKKVDLRIATLPTVWGEKVVMRILDNSTAQLDLAKLGFSQGNYDRFAESFHKPYGMILVTGPTGSGKSTTLYSTLNVIARPEVNIITVEDPVEYRLNGINQVQVNHKAGLTFASSLKSILRSDPDVVLIGEIRDYETAQIAIEAALTGHLVLTTLHTNDAPSSVTRLTEMGVEPFLVGSALDCVLAQRLARRLCTSCREEYKPTPETLDAARFPWDPSGPVPVLFRAVGCVKCANTGYKGRIALHEVMQVGETIERLAVERATNADITAAAKAEGMRPLRLDGMDKVLAGMTSLDEVLRVVI
jgi:type IV pilus assembly protein PilB